MSGECYLSYNQGIGPATIRQSDALPLNGYGAMPNAIAEARQMYSAGAETGPVGLPPKSEVPAPGPRASEAGYEIPHGLRQLDEPSGARTHPVSEVEMSSRGTVALHPANPGGQTVRPWVQDPSLASGLSLFPATPESSRRASSLKPGERARPPVLSLCLKVS